MLEDENKWVWNPIPVDNIHKFEMLINKDDSCLTGIRIYNNTD